MNHLYPLVCGELGVGVVFRSTWTEWSEEALAEAGLKPGTCMALGGFLRWKACWKLTEPETQRWLPLLRARIPAHVAATIYCPKA